MSGFPVVDESRRGAAMTLRRWLALCGVVAAVLIPASLFVGGSGSPDRDASAAKVLAHYRAHDSGNRLGALFMLIAAVLVVLFATRLREELRGGDTDQGMLALAAFGGGVLTAAGMAVAGVVHLALVSAADDHFATEAPPAQRGGQPCV